MAYIYKKIIQGKPYYYFRVSKRVNGKIVVKDIAYLGKDPLKLENKLKNLPSLYKKDIRNAYRNIKKFVQEGYYLKKVKKLKLKKDPYLTKRFQEDIEAIKLHFNNNFLKKNKITQEETYKNFLIDFAFNTTSLEGNTITLVEADRLLRENLTPKDRTLREIYDLQNTEKVFFDILKSKKEINHDFIIEIHDKLIENVDVRKGYRTHDIRVFKSRFKETHFTYVKIDMGILLKWYKQYENKLHPLVLASIFHQKFERIHPFSDGNGRAGRMILCYMLMRKNYPPLIVKKSNRGHYLDAMALADKLDLDNIEPKYHKDLVNYLAEELISSYWGNFLI